MRALLVTHDLSDRNAHLMPWRTVCEVVERGRQMGCELKLVSLGDRSGDIVGAGIPQETISISKCRENLEGGLCSAIEEWHGDIILWPVVWREPYWRIKVVSRLGIPVIGYFPGGVYRIADTLYAAERIGLRKALPYLAEAVWPKHLQLRRWQAHGFRHLIAMTSVTAEAVVAGGWRERLVSVIPPGRDDIVDCTSMAVLPDKFEEWRNSRPFYLFAGPPSGIRGIYELIKAFDHLANSDEDICLVCLFRSDAPLESEKIAGIIESMANRKRVYCLWDSLSKEKLHAFMSECHAIVLPFVAVPSEIPLAIIEAMHYKKPVITTMTGGSGFFVKEFGESVPLGDIEALTKAMRRLLVDVNHYQEKCAVTEAKYLEHPTWDVVAGLWIGCISDVLGDAA